MDDMTTVLIADDSIEFCEVLKDYFDETEDILVVDFASDGQEAYDKILNEKPDVVLLDVIMPRLDGIGVLKKLEDTELDKDIVYIVMSAIASDDLAKKCMKLGAHYYMVKPFEDIGMVGDRIKELKHSVRKKATGDEALPKGKQKDNPPQKSSLNKHAYKNKKVDIKAAVTDLMHEIGMPAHVKGYEFIRAAVLMCIEDKSIINSITKELYPEIAKAYNTNAPRVERAIRHAIELAWSRGKPEVITGIFGYTINNIKGKPTNGECIAMLSDHIRIKNSV